MNLARMLGLSAQSCSTLTAGSKAQALIATPTHRSGFDHYYRFQDANYGPANIPQYCLGVTGACMYVKRELINYIGILDEDFAFAFEDMDWCLRGWKAGYRSLYFPASVFTHKESASRPKHKTFVAKAKSSQ
jgi:GT2 family glycosyltransferase